MVAEVFAGISALKGAFALAKGLKDIDDATRRNAAVIELQEKIISAQAAQADLVETVGQLKHRVAELESWQTEKQNYRLSQIGPGVFCYMLKPDVQSAEPQHRLCANCYAQGKKSFFQQHLSGSRLDRFKCGTCGEEIDIHKDGPPHSPPSGGGYSRRGSDGWMAG